MVEQLHQLTLLANQKLSELLAEMLCLFPRSQENSAFFNCLFLNKLPMELHILLSEANNMANNRPWVPGQTYLRTTKASRLMMRLRLWPPFLSRSRKGRSPKWWQCAQERAAAIEAVEADSEERME
jgi:hypothetical protein